MGLLSTPASTPTPPVPVAPAPAPAPAPTPVTTPAPVPEPAAEPLKFLTFNVCGGLCEKAFSLARWTSSLLRETHDADAFFLQELCGRQFDALRNRLSGRYQATYVVTVRRNKACRRNWGDRRFGIAVFVKGPVFARGVWALPNPHHDEPRALLCVDAVLAYRPTRLCTTHVDYKGHNREMHVNYIDTVIRGWTGPLVIGGDLNLSPGTPPIRNLYRRFREIDPLARVTFPEQDLKIDYILFSNHFSGFTASGGGWRPWMSDHRVLRGTARSADL
ncbi:endonuclease/exonuclease/phosphatase family protein [Herbidospora cretacea]|uniref:endonuclease/exonuclease/phosphatase family protein n=1 Tax=Herbidospora cretacea TaxID=28444 RepID=UPI0009DF0D44|nr:endonuclease/exonuclease/phosphatase family protein [Herbidospora cretacea]